MVEQIMYIGIGFLIAGLLVIGVIPLVHARAVRLTMRRLEALTPLSITEIQADKDQLRAEFAMTMSRLEMSVEQMKAKTTNQLAELSRKSEAIGRLKLELGEKTAALFALEAKEKQLSDDLQTTQTELAAKTVALEEAERAREHADRARSGHRQLQRRLRRGGRPARGAGSAARADRGAEGPDRQLRERDQGAVGSPQQQDRRARGGETAACRGARARRQS